MPCVYVHTLTELQKLFIHSFILWRLIPPPKTVTASWQTCETAAVIQDSALCGQREYWRTQIWCTLQKKQSANPVSMAKLTSPLVATSTDGAFPSASCLYRLMETSHESFQKSSRYPPSILLLNSFVP